jgi:hypothetical protein
MSSARSGEGFATSGFFGQDGGLFLQGQTHTYHAKQLAQHLVMQMTDFPILANDIEVL